MNPLRFGDLSTVEVARQAGVHKDTLLRWLRAGLVHEPIRDRKGWRRFSPKEASAIVEFAQSESNQDHVNHGAFAVREIQAPYLGKIKSIDWDFVGAKTNYLTHGIHPYPAKFIPQIPNALIQELSSVGDTVADIFCGSGTTLVEALTLKRHAVGIDANPLACLISRAKTAVISEEESRTLFSLANEAAAMAASLTPSAEPQLFATAALSSKAWRPNFNKLDFWFEPHVIEELAEILSWCKGLQSVTGRELALTAFSSIIVAVSKQDSDTRYVRRKKNILPGEVFGRFSRILEQATRASAEYSELVETRFRCNVIQSNLLSKPEVPQLDLVVCSPPYPNAYSYHLYHMTRMLWLGMDQPRFKKEEMGSHRKYSSNSKNGATEGTFQKEFTTILQWLARSLKTHGYACFVVGDSTLKGRRINNADLISRAGVASGFTEVMRLNRTLQVTKKAFNPVIGNIKMESILILENRFGGL